jgi:glutathione S-transferase
LDEALLQTRSVEKQAADLNDATARVSTLQARLAETNLDVSALRSELRAANNAAAAKAANHAVTLEKATADAAEAVSAVPGLKSRLEEARLETSALRSELRSAQKAAKDNANCVPTQGLPRRPAQQLAIPQQRSLILRRVASSGKGQSIRLACAIGNVPVNDIQVTQQELDALRAKGELGPHGQLPAVEFPRPDGTYERFSCSGALLRLVGKLGGLYPHDPAEACRVDMLLDLEADLMLPAHLHAYPKEKNNEAGGNAPVEDGSNSGQPGTISSVDELTTERRAALLKKGGHLTRRLKQLEAVLVSFAESGCGPWAAGTERPTIADCALAPRLGHLASGELPGIPADLLAPYKLCASLVRRFHRIREVEKLCV